MKCITATGYYEFPVSEDENPFARRGSKVTISKAVADYFGKKHHHVLRDIDQLLIRDTDLAACFIPSRLAVRTGKGGTRFVRVYLINRRGLTVLALGYRGARAHVRKQRFLDVFDNVDFTEAL